MAELCFHWAKTVVFTKEPLNAANGTTGVKPWLIEGILLKKRNADPSSQAYAYSVP